MKKVHNKFKPYSYFLLIIIFLFLSNSVMSCLAAHNDSTISATGNISASKMKQLNSLVKKYAKKGKIPGVAVTIVSSDGEIFTKGFGYENLKTKSPVSADTLFELGSNSKAFTGLAVLKLEQDGLINLNDPVQKYIPWFHMHYKGTYKGEHINSDVTITLAQLLHHTSGIPFKSISDIPVSDNDKSLEETVRTQIGKSLENYPGETYLYATINYDILGLVIQNVSHMSYEDYIKKNIMTPLELNHTYSSRNETVQNELSKGYKLSFLRAREYAAPIYRGNTPAGYIITDSNDLGKWMKYQLHMENCNSAFEQIIEKSHQPDRSVSPGADGSSYAYGWSIFQSGEGLITHKGSNPNFSSYIVLDKEENIGIGVMSNLNSSYTDTMAYGIHDILIGNEPVDETNDLYSSLDNAASVIFIIVLLTFLINAYLFITLIINILKKKQTFAVRPLRALSGLFFTSLVILILGYCLYQIPDALFNGVTWSFSIVWAPHSFLMAISLTFMEIILYALYYCLSSMVTARPESSWFIVAMLSTVSGFSNALLIFIINEAIIKPDHFQFTLFLYFLVMLVTYVFGQRLVRSRLLKMTNNLVYSKRVYLLNQILSASYENFEQIENGKIEAGLNNDTETLSNFANIIITAATNIVTLLCCFVYLGILNKYALLISILVILIAGSIYYLVGKFANRIGEESRSIQNVFFRFINHLEYGFKELKLNLTKRNGFKNDMVQSCADYRDKRIRSDLAFANVFVVGEMLFTIVIGVVAFVFPVFLKDIQTSQLRMYVFVYIYMTGPLRVILNSIPQIINVNICYKRIQNLASELSSSKPAEIETTYKADELPDSVQLELLNVEYSYKNTNGDIFKVGPLNYQFNSGEIVYITGGNGSGKSTLAKLVTGLYTPDSGTIRLNQQEITSAQLRQVYSTVFSDYHLFENLYGVDAEGQKDKIAELLQVLQLDQKVTYSNNAFSTLKLSSGQKRRLALLVSYLENRPIYLFDEWASDQDPDFRKYFYETLLPELKRAGKCVIAITHDDRYFDLADKIIKMDFGKMK